MIQAPFGSYKEPDLKPVLQSRISWRSSVGYRYVCCIFRSFLLSSQPEVVASTMVPFETGVDEQSVTILRNKENELAAVSLTFQAKCQKSVSLPLRTVM